MAGESQAIRFARMVDAMRDASTYSSASADRGVDVRETHMSVVFLLDDVVYKVKKPIDYGFVDYTTLEKRKTMCENEVRLNQRLAPSVYLGVVAICYHPDSFVVEPAELSSDMHPIEYAVKMIRLSDEDTLLQAVRSRSIRKEDLRRIVSKIALFHNEIAERSPEISRFGSYDSIAYNVMENFAQTANHVEAGLIEAETYDEVKARQLQRIDELRALIGKRAADRCPCDSHGDLRLEHVYRSGDAINIIDCIEFNDRFRFGDPLCDIAFLYMDLFYETCSFYLPNAMLDYYMEASGIRPSASVKALALFYASYRSVVRAKVAGITVVDAAASTEVRHAARRRSRKHWNIARELILPAALRTGLVLISGLPGCGKSTVARFLSSKFPAERCLILRTDTVRKECRNEPLAYTKGGKAEVYSLILDRAYQAMKVGGVVIVDATFNSEGQLERFRQLAKNEGFVFAVLLCRCRDELTTQRRLESRKGDASDADWRVYDQMARSWIGPTEATESVELVDTTGSFEVTYANAADALRRIGLYESDHP